MSNKELGQEPAFAREASFIPNVVAGGGTSFSHQKGMSKRFYAAIKLQIPDSGEDWLDEMIRKKNRRDAACCAMQGILANEKTMANRAGIIDRVKNFIFGTGNMQYTTGEKKSLVKTAYEYADELLKQENE